MTLVMPTMVSVRIGDPTTATETPNSEVVKPQEQQLQLHADNSDEHTHKTFVSEDVASASSQEDDEEQQPSSTAISEGSEPAARLTSVPSVGSSLCSLASHEGNMCVSSCHTCVSVHGDTPSSSSFSSKRSILKQRRSLVESINNKSSAWKVLPPVDLASVCAAADNAAEADIEASGPQTPDDVEPTQPQEPAQRRRVSFHAVEIRCYSQTIGDNPSVSYGPPISLDWQYEALDVVTLDQYEDHRPPRRSLREMVLSYYHRRNVLTWQYGHSEEELRAAKHAANRIKSNRAFTQALLPAMLFEAVLESLKRKIKRLACRSNDDAITTTPPTTATE